MRIRALSSLLLFIPTSCGVAELTHPRECQTHFGEGHPISAPSFVKINRTYQTTKGDVVDRLRKKIRRGGSGSFGSVPMPTHPDLKPADLTILVHWILGLHMELPGQYEQAIGVMQKSDCLSCHLTPVR